MNEKSYNYQPMTTVSNNVYFEILDQIVDKYNRTNHGTVKIKSIDAHPDTYIDFDFEVND